ncbi:Nup120p KNAG_0M02220 [Huiozyma naganishii CBS 8797]|uniref:Uncharacterized protein n=1 Tax=Huiozyma naganishii (strain ATCC MYA-139 / BCRC 22969 / CBS 8797 / KCTC 17520 / NBRC 10181 / NCYC 3082 / Yp74L-3) TaxID=1071383 RepID=J7RE10_HUIN7|nr:hypothetical protein KNAG_0M02220 [Kazachstania naganishii CBS 8797]CCK73075.1 hypothetical protein KNAG_0M02220 [Kazachstania naganishii CBS 8797]
MSALLSKVDVSISELFGRSERSLDLYLGDPVQPGDGEADIPHGINMIDSAYSSTINLPDSELFCFSVSLGFDCITMYRLTGHHDVNVVQLHMNQQLMNMHHTMTLHATGRDVVIRLVLKDGKYAVANLPLQLFDDLDATKINGIEWFKVYSPYDFSVRVPHLLYTVSPEFSVVFLEDGGLLGLKNVGEDLLEPALFNDSSYFQSMFSIFRKLKSNGSHNGPGKVVSCSVFQERYLILLTEFCFLRIWDLTTFNLIQNYDLSNGASDRRAFDVSGNYLSLFHNILVIFSPNDSGTFHIGTLSVDNAAVLQFQLKNRIQTNITSSAIWFLSDMKLGRPIDLNYEKSYVNLSVLWKSGNASKLQILNIQDDDLVHFEWIESSSRSISEPNSELDLITHVEDAELEYDTLLLQLKAHYPSDILEKAQNILSANNIVVNINTTTREQNLEYLSNLQTILKDLKAQCSEVSTISVYKDEIIFVNCLKRYSHSAYKANPDIDNFFLNINAESKDNDEVSTFLKPIDKFVSTLPREILPTLSEQFINIISHEKISDLTPQEKFTHIFKSTLQSEINLAALQELYQTLNSLDTISALNNLIENHLDIIEKFDNKGQNFISSIRQSPVINILAIKGLHQHVSIQHHFVLEVLLTFVFLETNYSLVEAQLSKLLEIHFKQALFLRMVQRNKLLLIEEIFLRTTKHGNGVDIYSYADWNRFIQHATQQIYNTSLDSNQYLWRFLDKYIINRSPDVSRRDSLVFENSISSKFYIRGNQVHELIEALCQFVCGKYDESYELFQKHDNYVNLTTESLPRFLLQSKEGANLWTPLLQSLDIQTFKRARFNYYLSCLFNQCGNRPDLALRAIKTSIEFSLLDDTDSEQLDIATEQHQQLLNLLIHFGLFEEVVDVLRLSHDALPLAEKTKYFELLLRSPDWNGTFFSKVLQFCESHKDEPLSYRDREIIDSILQDNLASGDWQDYKRLYSFRLLSGSVREAAETIYQYYKRYQSTPGAAVVKRKCYLIVMNILATFDTKYDQWLLDGNDVVTLEDLKSDTLIV